MVGQFHKSTSEKLCCVVGHRFIRPRPRARVENLNVVVVQQRSLATDREAKTDRRPLVSRYVVLLAQLKGEKYYSNNTIRH